MIMNRIIGWWTNTRCCSTWPRSWLGRRIGLAAPQLAPALEHSIEPVLILLLFATFLAVPLIEVGKAFRDIRFLGTVLVGNFIIVPAVVFGLSRFVADDRGLMLGVLLVLLTPCIDYVIVFSGSRRRQRPPARRNPAADAGADPHASGLSVPLRRRQCSQRDRRRTLPQGVPPVDRAALASAAVVQGIARRHRAGQAIEKTMAGAMVPLMMVTPPRSSSGHRSPQ